MILRSLPIYLAVMLLLLTSHIFIHCSASIRNLGGRVEYNVSISEFENIDLLSFIMSLLETAELLDKYNASLADDLRDVAGLLITGNVDDAYEKYMELLPYLEELIRDVGDVDPELAAKLLSIITGEGAQPYRGELPELANVSTIMEVGRVNVGGLSSNMLRLPPISPINIGLMLFIIIIPTILYFSYTYREVLLGFISPRIRRKIDNAMIRFKLGPPPKTPHEIIIYNYRKFLYLIGRMGIKKEGHETPREFLCRLGNGYLKAARELTTLFEKARYSPYQVEDEDVDKSYRLTRQIEGMIL